MSQQKLPLCCTVHSGPTRNKWNKQDSKKNENLKESVEECLFILYIDTSLSRTVL